MLAAQRQLPSPRCQRISQHPICPGAMQAGPDVCAVTLPMDGVRNKGFGFLEYETPESAAYAVDLFKGNLRLFDRQLRVDFGGKGGGGGGGAPGSTGRTGVAVARVPSFTGAGNGPGQQLRQPDLPAVGGTPAGGDRASLGGETWAPPLQQQQEQQQQQQQAYQQQGQQQQPSNAAAHQQMLAQQVYASTTGQQQRALLMQLQTGAAYGQAMAGQGVGVAGPSPLAQQQQQHPSHGFSAHPPGQYYQPH
ncbi:hypothetical protein ABPG77_008635 [Micractinium sp. CCAP 211/92]